MRPIALPLTPPERACVDQLKAAAALPDDADLLRLALWRLALHYDLQPPVDLFAIRGAGRRRHA